jgi:hypothetical protein
LGSGTAHFDIFGTFKKAVPRDYKICVAELTVARNYRPRRIATIDNDHEWKAVNVFSGDKSGDEKLLLVGLLEPGALVLFNYWEKVGTTYKYQNRPSIDGFDAVFHECARVRVRLK